jgi:hypothetical protein
MSSLVESGQKLKEKMYEGVNLVERKIKDES